MKLSTIVCTIAAASLGFGAVAQAQDNDWRDQRGQRDERRFDHRDDRRAGRHEDRRDFGYNDGRRNDRHNYYGARGPDFRRGGYMPREYRNRQYYITDYRSYRLNRPPYGHQWVQVGSDYVLIAIATGLIANIILNY